MFNGQWKCDQLLVGKLAHQPTWCLWGRDHFFPLASFRQMSGVPCAVSPHHPSPDLSLSPVHSCSHHLSTCCASVCLRMPAPALSLGAQCHRTGVCFPESFSLCAQHIKQQTVTVGPTSAKSTDAGWLCGRRLSGTRQCRYLEIKTTAFLPRFLSGLARPKERS